MNILVSVRSVEEALAAVRGGADFIDLKEPSAGALGGLPPVRIASIVRALRAVGAELPVSATIGDLVDAGEIRERVEAVGRCGVDYVKVGLFPGVAAGALLESLAVCGPPVVPVLVVDRGLDEDLVEIAVGRGFPAIMLDTADKSVGSLFDAVGLCALNRFVARVHEAGALAGLAGALRVSQLPVLAALDPDFAGFRSAVCAGARDGELDEDLLRRLRNASRIAQPPAHRFSHSNWERTRAISVH